MSKEIQGLFEAKWYLMEKDQQHGPFTYLELIKKFQDNQVLDYQYVWAPHFEEWKMICATEEFSKKYIQWVFEHVYENNGQFFFNRRKSTRKKIQCEVSGHNAMIFMTGNTESLSMNGCEVELDYPLLQVQDKVLMHFAYPKDLGLNFNAQCEVLQKKYSPKRLHQKMKVKYILKFLHKNEEKRVGDILSQED